MMPGDQYGRTGEKCYGPSRGQGRNRNRRRRRIPISTHLYPEVAAHVMRVSETAHWLEWQDWANPILQQPYEVKAGKVHIPDVPGIGLEWDEKAVAAHLADNF
jgi:L-alanine-DL-glutamate epimerase-like enolase superfamily enzyme